MENILLILFLIISIYTDIKYRKVFNISIITVILLGSVLHFASSGSQGLIFSAIGILAGFGLLFIPYIFGAIGAGDVKFLAAAGCLKGYKFIFWGGIYGILLAGLYSLIYLIFKKKLYSFINRILSFNFNKLKLNTKLNTKEDSVPYVVFLSIGLVIKLF